MPKQRTTKQLSELIQKLHNKHRKINSGKLASYIPELGNVDPRKFAISITTVHGETMTVGDADSLFTIQSISKPFVFGQALESHGLRKVRSHVDVEPTGDPFHSMNRLQKKSEKPSNPLVNTGAIAMTNLTRGKNSQAGQSAYKKMIEGYAGRKLSIDLNVYKSEKATGHRNRAMAHLMLQYGMIHSNIEQTIDLYFRQCSYNINTVDLSVMAASLANSGINPITNVKAIDQKYVKHLLTLMLTCGLYNYAGEWAFNVGIPAKSGVSGGILAVVPGQMGIGVYSPLIDTHGNSVRGLKVFNELSSALNLHIFG
jgi:glutaminase